MSDRSTDLLLEDILESIVKIEGYVKGLEQPEFLKDSKTIDAVVRNLEVIGEAARHLPDEFKNSHTSVPWPQVVGLRHRIVHEYFGVDLELIWQIVKSDLPQLKASIEEGKNQM